MKVYFAQLNKIHRYGIYAEKEITGDFRIIFADNLEQAKTRIQNSLVSNERYTDIWNGNIKECLGFKIVTGNYGDDVIIPITK